MKTLSPSSRSTKGAALLIVVLFFVIISGTLLIGVVNPVANQIRNTTDFLKSKQSYATFERGDATKKNWKKTTTFCVSVCYVESASRSVTGVK